MTASDIGLHDEGISAPLLSVVMPTLNQRRFIAEAVHSVLGQGVAGLELVVVDGVSSDGTQDELAALAEAYPGRLRWVSQRDDGPAQAVNRAVALARGDLIGWLNSDDLYTPGAVERALAVLQARPEVVMVYGEGLHVDVAGQPFERYPTQPPRVGVTHFRQGCFICQPTAFFRRAAFESVGGLDESLRASFDFDLWLKMFLRWPEGIAFVPEVQAHSRLHEGGITLSQRERVAVEGMAVLHRHLAWAPPVWMLTHFEERCETHPFAGPAVDLCSEAQRLIERVRGYTTPQGLQVLKARLQEDRRLRIGGRHSHARIHADGWAPAELEVVLRQPVAAPVRLRLRGRHESPVGGPLHLAVMSPDGRTQRMRVLRHGPFELMLDAPAQPVESRQVWRITCLNPFVPARCERGSTDARALAFQVDALDLLESAAPA